MALWWLAAPYAGIRHDAIFYAGDALRRLHPQALAGDIFFHQGSQGDFSVFGRFYAALIQRVGLDVAAFVVALAGRLAWLAAVLWLVRTLAPSRDWLLLLAAALCLPAAYGPLDVLARAEPFATPRIFAEAASLAAVVLALRARWALAAAAWAVGMVVHPLMAVFAGALLVCLLPARLRWTSLAAVALLLAWAWARQWPPLPRLLHGFDADWWAVVDGRNAMILWPYWTVAQISHAVLALLMLADVVRRRPEDTAQTRLALGLLATALVCLGTWWWASQQRNVLLLQIQPWRVLWLLELLAPMLWLAVVWRAGWPARPTKALVPTVLLLLAWLMPYWPAAGVGAVALALQAAPAGWPTRHRGYWLALLTGGLAAILLLDALSPLLLGALDPAADVRWPARIGAWLATPMVTLLLLATAWLAWRGRPLCRPAQALALVAGLSSLVVWSSWMLVPPPDQADRRLAAQARAVIPPGATVWSELGLANTWFELQRQHYASSAQGAGAQFDRDLALTLRARLDRLRSLELTSESWQLSPAKRVARRSPDIARIRLACEDQALDWLVFRGSTPAAHVVIGVDGSLARLSLYDCRKLRGMPHA